jgi:putative flippase GtrA
MKEIYRFAKFAIVGVSNTLLTLLTYWLLVYFGMYFVTANIIGYTLGVVNSYFWNSKYVFEKIGAHTTTIPKFVVVNLIVLGLTTTLLYMFVERIGLNKYIVQLMVIPVGMVSNYILNKAWTFKTRK